MDAIAFRLRVFLLVLIAELLAGTFGFARLEGLPWIDSLYFSVVTVATVGYGDIHPVTTAGKLLAVVLIVTGVGTFLGVVANATDLLLERRQERLRKERLSMVVGLFFSEIGTRLLRLIAETDPGRDTLRAKIRAEEGWTEPGFRRLAETLAAWDYRVTPEGLDLAALKDFLGEKGGLLLRLLENPNLLEHESFTHLLRAVFHLKEELLHRSDLARLPDSDRQHLAGDALRAYPLLAQQWLSHLRYLKAKYPYLFSLAVRTSPFLEEESPIVR
jgi:voltage-gated potassium channel